jgi:hypothetical protein
LPEQIRYSKTHSLLNGRLRNDGGYLLEIATRLKHYLRQASVNHRVRPIRFFNDFLESVMCHNIQPVDRRHSCALAVGEPETPANGLFYENPRIGRAQRYNRIKDS